MNVALPDADADAAADAVGQVEAAVADPGFGVLYEVGQPIPLLKWSSPCCHNHALVWDHHAFVTSLRRDDKPWVSSAVSSIAKMLFHRVDGRGSGGGYGATKALLFCDETPKSPVFQGPDLGAMEEAKQAGRLDKVVVVTLLDGRFAVIVFDIKTKEVRLVDGKVPSQDAEYRPGSGTAFSYYTQRWFDKCEAVFGGDAASYTWVYQPYILDSPEGNCGPIAVLAVHHELTGGPMAGEVPGSPFSPDFRGAVVDFFVSRFKELHRANMLVCTSRRDEALEPWDYVDPTLAAPVPGGELP